MEIPNTIFIALGVIIAATVTGVFSFISLINQKEGKVSEFRQNWIDSLREDISKMTSSLDRISTSWQLIEIQEKQRKKTFEENSWMEKFNELIKEDQIIFSECHNRILLRLNKKNDALLIDELRQAKNILSNPRAMFDKRQVQLQIDKIINLSQDLLKNEWEVVKAGEKPYRTSKIATILIIFLLFVSLLYSFNVISSLRSDSPNIGMQPDAATPRR